MYKIGTVIVITFLLCLGQLLIAQSGGNQTFNTPGIDTWTAPACVTSVTVEVWGAGGGAGGETATDGGTGGGGGGAYSSMVLNLVAGTIYNLEVGTGGIGGNGGFGGGVTESAGENGGDSWFLDATTVMAKGGGGGAAGTASAGGVGGDAATGFGAIKFSGGDAGAGNQTGNPLKTDLFGGGGGSSAGPGGNGMNGADATDAGGGAGGIAPAGGGNGGEGSSDSNQGSGTAGAAPGGGAGGSADASPGTDGTAGQIVITWEVAIFNDKTTTICSNETFDVIMTDGVDGDEIPAGTTYSWGAPTVTGGITGGSAQASQASISQSLTNPTATVQTATYDVIPSTSNCPFQVVVTVNPLPKLSSTLTPPAICSEAVFNYIPTSTTAGATFAWDRAFATGITEAANTGADDPSEVLTNTTAAAITVRYVYITSANGCSNAGENVNVIVNPLPAAAIGGDVTLCLDDPQPNITITGSNTTPPYTFTYNINGILPLSVASDGAGIATVAVPTNPAGTFNYNLVSVDDGACTQAQTGTAVVVINPLGASLSGNTTVCHNVADPTIIFTGSGGVAPYVFTYNIGAGDLTATSDGAGVAVVSAPTNFTGDFVYTLTSVEDDNALTCISASSVIVTVLPLPTATIGNSTTVCLDGTPPDIVLTGLGGSPDYSFDYTENGTSFTVTTAPGESTVTVQPSTAVVGNIIYEITNVQEGSAVTCAQNQSEMVTVTIQAPAEGIVQVDNTRECEGGPSPLMTFTGTAGQAPFVFYYSTNIPVNGSTTHSVSTVGINTSIDVAVPTDVPDSIVYTITDIQDGTGLICGIGGSFDSVIIDPLPISTITAAFNDVCLGDPDQELYFEAIGVPAPVTFDYFISVDGGPNQAEPSVTSALGELTYTLTVPINTLGTTVYTNGVSNSNVCTGTGSGSARLTVNPIPTAAIIGDATICDNTSSNVTFTGAVGTPPFTFTYNINGGAAKTISSTSGVFTADLLIDTIPGIYTINLLAVSDIFNCNQAQTGSVTIIVNPLPTATAGGNEDICISSTAIVIGATSSNGTINWTHDGTGTLNNPTTLSPNYDAGTGDVGNNVILTMTVTSDNTCNPELATAIYTLSIDSLPLAEAGGNITICENANHTVIGTNARFGSVAWTHDGTGTLTNTTSLRPTYIATSADAENTVTLTMTVSSTNACAPQTDNATYIINVDPLPAANAGSTTAICKDGTATISGANAYPASATIAWTHDGNGTLTDANTLTPSYSSVASDAGGLITLTMEVSTNNACGAAPDIATTTFNIYESLTATLTLQSEACLDEVVNAIFTLTSTNSTPIYTFSYLENGVSKLAQSVGNNITSTPVVITSIAEDVEIELISISDDNCSETLYIPTKTLTVHPLPTGSISDVADVCQYVEADDIIFEGETGTGPFTFNYTINDEVEQITSQSVNDSSTAPVSSDKGEILEYKLVSVTDANCTNNNVTASQSVEIFPLPIADFQVSPEQTSILEPTISIYDASASTTNWFWDFGDEKQSSEENVDSHTYADTGNYIITLITSNGPCHDTTSQTVIIKTPLLIYIPTAFTPTGDGINETFSPKGDGIEDYTMEIYDRWGNMIFYTDDINKGWDGKANGGSDIAQIDVYVYVINVIDIKSIQSHTYRGVVNLLQ